MEQANLEASQQFQKNNGMSIEEAYKHINTWYEEGKYSEAIDGCEEVINYIPNYENVEQILKDAKRKIQETQPPVEESVSPQENVNTAKQAEKSKANEEYKAGPATDEKILSAIGYISFLCILPLLLKKDSKYCSFHGKQALVLAIVFFLYRYLGILRDVPGIGGLIRFMLGVILLLELVIIIIAMIQAYRGKYWKIPLIYGMSKKLKF